MTFIVWDISPIFNYYILKLSQLFYTSSLAKSPVREFTNKELIDIYKQSIFHKAVVFDSLTGDLASEEF